MLPLEIFSKLSCSFQTWIVLILPHHHRFKCLIKGKVLPGCGRKRAPSDSITFLFLSSCFCMCITYAFCSQVLSQSSFYALFCLTCFCLVIFQFCFVYNGWFIVTTLDTFIFPIFLTSFDMFIVRPYWTCHLT